MRKSLILVDSHAHLDMEEFDEDRREVIERARQEGIRAILCPADLTNQKGTQTTLDLADTEKNIVAAAGVKI